MGQCSERRQSKRGKGDAAEGPFREAWRSSLLHLFLNVNPGLINSWLINRGVSTFSGDSSLLEGTPPE